MTGAAQGLGAQGGGQQRGFGQQRGAGSQQGSAQLLQQLVTNMPATTTAISEAINPDFIGSPRVVSLQITLAPHGLHLLIASPAYSLLPFVNNSSRKNLLYIFLFLQKKALKIAFGAD